MTLLRVRFSLRRLMVATAGAARDLLQSGLPLLIHVPAEAV